MSTLPSEQVILAAPMSFAGSTKRIWHLFAGASFAGSTRRIWRRWHPPAVAAHGLGKAGYRTVLVTLLVLAWLGLLSWYGLFCLLLVSAWLVVLMWYGMFGILLVPYRLIRRSQRRGRRDAMRHREMLAQIAAGRADYKDR